MNVGIGYKNIKNSKHLALLQEEQAILFEIVAHHLKKKKKQGYNSTWTREQGEVSSAAIQLEGWWGKRHSTWKRNRVLDHSC